MAASLQFIHLAFGIQRTGIDSQSSGPSLGFGLWLPRVGYDSRRDCYATTVFELWPLIMVTGLARHERIDSFYRIPSSISRKKDRSYREHLVLLIFAAVAIVFMLGSQSRNGTASLQELTSFNGLLGIALALTAACLVSLGVTATLVYGKLLYYGIVDERQEERDPRRIDERSLEDRKLLLWLTMLGFVIAKAVGLPVNIIMGAIIWDFRLDFDRLGLLGSILIGLAFAANAILLRAGNIRAAGPEVNAWNFLSPVLALLLLVFVGVSLPRFDLFVVGSALIIVINILIQLRPEQQQLFERSGTISQRGTRLGFHSFHSVYLNIWHATYLRDEVMPTSWLCW